MPWQGVRPGATCHRRGANRRPCGRHGDQLPLYRGAVPIAPPVFAIVPVWPVIKEALADDEFGLDVGRIVHGEQRMTFHRLIRAGDALTSSGHLSSITERGENEVFVLSLETKGRGRVPRDFAGRRLRLAGNCSGQGRRKARLGALGGGARRSQRRTGTRAPRRVSPAGNHHRYAGASGDDNRIHVDDEFAKSVGLPGIIVQGMCLFSISMQAVIDAAAGGRPELLEATRSAPISEADSAREHVRDTRLDSNGDGARFEGRGPNGDLAVRGTARVR